MSCETKRAAAPSFSTGARGARRTPRRFAAFALAPLLLAAGAAAAGPEKPADSFTDRTTSVLVEVPVEVTRDGQPVRGLGAADFELFDNGRPQEILAVDVVDLAALAGRPAAERPALPVAARRHFLLLFDRSFSTPASLEKARLAASRFVREDLDPADLVAVATFSTRDGVRLPLGFTPDRDQALLAVQNLGEVQAASLRPDPLRLYVGDRKQLRDPGEDLTPGNRNASQAAREQAQQISQGEQRRANVQGRREVKILSDSLRSLAGLMRQVGGRKHVIYFSEGFDSSLLLGSQNEQEVEQNNQAAAAGEIWRIDSDAVFGNRGTLSALDQLTDALRKADCTLHSVDVAGLRAGSDVGLAAGKKGKDGLFLMARDTGGELFENFNDLGAAMQQLLEKTSVTYLLSYRPQDLEFDGKYRKLKVKLKSGSGGRIVHRPGYFAPAPGGEEDFGTLLSAASRLLDRRQGEIETRVLALPSRQPAGDPEGRLTYVPTFVDVVGATFLAPPPAGKNRPPSLRADLFVYAFDEAGGIADFFSQAVTLDLGQVGEAFARTGLRLYAPLALGPGRYTLRAMVRDPASGRSGVASAEATVTAPGEAQAALPSVPKELAEDWILARGRRKDLAGLVEPADPFAVAAQMAIASLAPAAAAPPPAEDAGLVERSVAGMREGYRRALAAQPGDSFERTVERLEQFELAALGEDPEGKSGRLGRAEMEVARQLAAGGGEALVPLLEAHLELYLRHKAARRAYLEKNSRQQVAELAALHAERGEAAKAVAARALASLGGYLLADGRSSALQLLEQAAALDRRNEAAFLGLAIYHEKRGGPYESAVEALERLVESRPESREGRLRLAINLLRVARQENLGGKAMAKRAEQLFQSLLAAPDNDWLTSLAAQELARYEFSTGRLPAAVDLLEKTLSRRPVDQELLVQLAFLYDRQERGGSPALLDRLGREQEPGEAPRGRYNQWQSEALARDRSELQDGARQLKPILDQALAKTATQEGR